jgi:LPS O-antigen subunit length determinant protein (WzzB/FepE family)
MLSIFLKRHGWLVALCGLLSAVIAFGIASMWPKQWAATLLLQVGQIGPAPLADPNNTVQRVKFPGFALQVLESQKLTPESAARADLMKASLSASLEKGSNLIHMSVKGHSQQEATENLKAAFKVLESEHSQLLAPSLARLQRSIDETARSLEKIEEERQTILEPINQAKKSNNIDKKFSESILLASMMKSNDTEARSLRDQKTALEEQLSPYRTFNTKMVTPIYTPRAAVFPNKLFAALLGLLLGIVAGAAWVVRQDKQLQAALGRLLK